MYTCTHYIICAEYYQVTKTHIAVYRETRKHTSKGRQNNLFRLLVQNGLGLGQKGITDAENKFTRKTYITVLETSSEIIVYIFIKYNFQNNHI